MMGVNRGWLFQEGGGSLRITVRLTLSCCFLQDIGAGKGKYYAVNFPLRDGIDDDSYEKIFNPVSKIAWFLSMIKELSFC